jgi:hypothetical protein
MIAAGIGESRAALTVEPGKEYTLYFMEVR